MLDPVRVNDRLRRGLQEWRYRHLKLVERTLAKERTADHPACVSEGIVVQPSSTFMAIRHELLKDSAHPEQDCSSVAESFTVHAGSP